MKLLGRDQGVGWLGRGRIRVCRTFFHQIGVARFVVREVVKAIDVLVVAGATREPFEVIVCARVDVPLGDELAGFDELPGFRRKRKAFGYGRIGWPDVLRIGKAARHGWIRRPGDQDSG